MGLGIVIGAVIASTLAIGGAVASIFGYSVVSFARQWIPIPGWLGAKSTKGYSVWSVSQAMDIFQEHHDKVYPAHPCGAVLRGVRIRWGKGATVTAPGGVKANGFVMSKHEIAVADKDGAGIARTALFWEFCRLCRKARRGGYGTTEEMKLEYYTKVIAPSKAEYDAIYIGSETSARYSAR